MLPVARRQARPGERPRLGGLNESGPRHSVSVSVQDRVTFTEAI